jgi:hypothetical protein
LFVSGSWGHINILFPFNFLKNITAYVRLRRTLWHNLPRYNFLKNLIVYVSSMRTYWHPHNLLHILNNVIVYSRFIIT